ncbi:MAG: exopolysaccharide biosynthesis protein [Gammaproteobacteria bacterium]|nr:exopolysaccharide biosynthesis protein [Gammaproteobacteria bacterium]
MEEVVPDNLEAVLNRIDEAAGSGRISFGEILDAVGRRSFGPILLIAGLVTLAPIIGDIPGIPTIMGVLVLLTAGQMLYGRQSFWLPETLLKRNAAGDTVRRAVTWLRRPAHWLDRIIRPRLPLFVRGPAVHGVALVCIAIALAMPPMELVPFSANGAGLALTVFGMALIGGDGLLVLVAGMVTIATFWVVISSIV